MKTQALKDYVTGKKKAFSPAAGGGFHVAGRAFDLDLSWIRISFAEFWKIAEKHGVLPIISKPNSGVSESWHFDFRGSHQQLYQYYFDGYGNNLKPYSAAAASAILSIGAHVDAFGENQIQESIQSYQIRLGKVIGNIDGLNGRRKQKAIEELLIPFTIENPGGMLVEVQNIVQEKFSNEFTLPIH